MSKVIKLGKANDMTKLKYLNYSLSAINISSFG